MTEYILILGFIVILIALFLLWILRKGISNTQKSPEFSNLEKAAIRRQMLSSLGLLLLILFFVLSPLVWNEFPPYALFIALIIGFAPLAYIAVSSIKNRVSILQGDRDHLPVKGTKAVKSGVMNLVFIFLVFIGFALYFASFK
jgi:hypothetical protein